MKKKSKPIDYAKLGREVGDLVKEKQKSYGDSFHRSGECLRQMYPNGITPTQYDDVLTIARVLDKLFRIANHPTAFNDSPYRDMAGYSLLGLGRFNKQYDKNRAEKITKKRAIKRSNSKRKRS